MKSILITLHICIIICIIITIKTLMPTNDAVIMYELGFVGIMGHIVSLMYIINTKNKG